MTEMKILALSILGWDKRDNPDYNTAFRKAIDALRSHATHEFDEQEEWLNIDVSVSDKPLGLVLKKELRYLTLKKVLRWHPRKPNLVQIVEVPA